MTVQEPKRNNKTAPLCCYCSQCGSRSPQMEIVDQDKVEDNINHARQSYKIKRCFGVAQSTQDTTHYVVPNNE